MSESVTHSRWLAKPVATWKRIGKWLDLWAFTLKPNDTASWQSKQEILQRLKRTHKK